MSAARCQSCLTEFAQKDRRFVVFVPSEADPYGGREDVVCVDCVGWYHDGSVEITGEGS